MINERWNVGGNWRNYLFLSKNKFFPCVFSKSRCCIRDVSVLSVASSLMEKLAAGDGVEFLKAEPEFLYWMLWRTGLCSARCAFCKWDLGAVQNCLSFPWPSTSKTKSQWTERGWFFFFLWMICSVVLTSLWSHVRTAWWVKSCGEGVKSYLLLCHCSAGSAQPHRGVNAADPSMWGFVCPDASVLLPKHKYLILSNEQLRILMCCVQCQ